MLYTPTPTPKPEFPTLPSLKRPSPKTLITFSIGILAVAALLWLPSSLDADARLTLAVFVGAVFLWVFSSVPDTYVALGAACLLVIFGIIDVEKFFQPLGDDTTWLLIGAFVIAAAVTTTGLAPRATAWLCTGVESPRALVHLLTLAIVCTAFMIPATSGRAALILPVFLALVPVLENTHRWLAVSLSIILPSVVLLSAVASFIGAGAHLITAQILEESGFDGISFTQWMLYGLPLALVSSHISAEVIYLATSTRKQRQQPLSISQHDFPPQSAASLQESRTLMVLGVAITLWLSESLHQIPPALVAIICALMITSPRFGAVDLNGAIKKVPWSLLLFMTATVAISHALKESGAAEIMASAVFGKLPSGPTAVFAFVIAVIIISSAAHLLIQSRSARSAVLIPLVISLALPLGINPVAVAFISTAAAGFCHSLPSSAKPLVIFYSENSQEHPSFTQSQLLRISALLFPFHVAILAVFAFWLWPLMGLDLLS
ncbi:MAG: SLC13 family permease [Corynebacterium sp.]|uniref:SLC13 family permease n=1 Tax=Corynebacterium sp. TaxID=1720 RepID=UPI0026DD0E50|nr:SLC13 family permease [Corynebacterium sp.]MDO4762457.1 SLC13 family permease [Corynebacterium sp.]